ncbi:MAG: glycerophosphodiester phosphodiesterase family protein [Chloroflexota bacterium]|nr:glycerophosphodiester phosphodiesterase family protein [Chloroflexota bacterium]
MIKIASFSADWWQKHPLIFGHRGASHQAPQNTLAAFRAAANLGADGVELDVQLTKDGVPIIMHNQKVDETTNGHGLVTELTLARIKELDAGSSFSPEFVGEQIPTLEETLATLGQRLLFNIELKPAGKRSVELVNAVAEIVQRLHMNRRVWFSSYEPYLLYRMHALRPEIPGGILCYPPTLFSQLLSLVTPHEALHPHFQLISEKMVQRIHRHGMRLVTWTVDSLEVAQRLANWGVDVLISNEPDKLLEALR